MAKNLRVTKLISDKIYRSSLHRTLQVAHFQRCERVFAYPIMLVSSCVWHTFSCVCIFYKQLCFCVLYRVKQCSIFISRQGCPEASIKAAVMYLVQYYSDVSRSFFFKRVDRIESSKEPEPVPSMSGLGETAACSLFLIADDPSALPSPTSPHSSRQ